MKAFSLLCIIGTISCGFCYEFPGSVIIVESEHGYEQSGQKYNGPPAPLKHDGTVDETDEVKHVKAVHSAAIAQALAQASKSHGHDTWQPQHPDSDLRYHGPPAPLKHDGSVDETPEVKHLKAKHFAALAEATYKAKTDWVPQTNHNTWKRSAHGYAPVSDERYHGPPAPLKHDGSVDETPEVKHLKHKHLAAVADALAKAPKWHSPEQYHEPAVWKQSHADDSSDIKYHGPPAPLKHDGTVDETPEVKHLKHKHLAALSEAIAKAPKWAPSSGHNKESAKWVLNSHHDSSDIRYHGPPAPLKHDGTVDETPEVKHLKHKHLSTVAEALAKAPAWKPEYEHSVWKRSLSTGGWSHNPLDGSSDIRYHGPPAPLKHDGTVDETPEVKHLKHKHLAALSEAIAKAPKWAPSRGQNDESEKWAQNSHHDSSDIRYHGPPAPLKQDGTVDETPEVKYLKHKHLATVAEALAKAPAWHPEDEHMVWKRSLSAGWSQNPHDGSSDIRYHGPPAPLKHDGTVDETPEVKHLKHKHLATVAEALAKAPKWQIGSDHNDESSGWSQNTHGGSSDIRYHGPLAPLKHDGTVDETPEVKHLKHKHLAAVAEAFAKAPAWKPKHKHSVWKRSAPSGSYYGPPAPLKHDGTVDETPEVKNLKHKHLSTVAEALAKAPKWPAASGHRGESAGWTHTYAAQPEIKCHGPPAPLKQDGTVDETPEVKHLKHKHLASVAEAIAKVPKWHASSESEKKHSGWEQNTHYGSSDIKYHGPLAPLKHDGTVDETPEVKHAKHTHLASLAEAFAKAPAWKPKDDHNIWKRSLSSGHYHGPPAPLKHDGTVDETPEVKHAKHKHLSTVAEALAKAPKWHSAGDHDEGLTGWHQSDSQDTLSEKYQGPLAPLKHDGTVDETPEVKHATAKHLASLYEAYAKAPTSWAGEQKSHVWKRSVEHGYLPMSSGHYQGPPAPLKHDGTVDETPEVKRVKAERLAALSQAFANAPRGKGDSHSGWDQSNQIQSSHSPAPKNYGNAETSWQRQSSHTSSSNLRYHGPPAPLKHDGTVDETPEVKRVKAARLSALAEAFAKAAPWVDESPADGHEIDEDHNLWKRSHPEQTQAYFVQNSHPTYTNHQSQPHPQELHMSEFKYNGPPAPLKSDGTVDDTDEVKYLKALHLSAVAEAFAKAPKHDPTEEHHKWKRSTDANELTHHILTLKYD